MEDPSTRFRADGVSMKSFLLSRAMIAVLAGVPGSTPALATFQSVTHDSIGERLADSSVITVPTATREGENSHENITDICFE